MPSYLSGELKTEKQAIEKERSRLQSLDAELDALGRDIDNQRFMLDRGNQYALNQFNAKVNRYNAILEDLKMQRQAFNQRVQEYNDKLRHYGQ